jgi:hypothetical protein
MKYNGLVFIVIGFIFLSSPSSDSHPQSAVRDPNVQLSISASKENYVRGEVVIVNLHLENRSSEKIRIWGAPHPENTHTQFYVSRDGKDFVKYSNSEWGRKPPVPGLRDLLPNQSTESKARIFWNEKPVVHHLNPDAARRVQEDKILTDYVFPDAGRYFVKAAVWGMIASNGRVLPKVESEPIEITIEEPEGQDLDAWNAIKDREDIAFFLQEGSFRGSYKSVGERKSREYDEIAARYPNSIISAQLRQKLREYRTRLGIDPLTISN